MGRYRIEKGIPPAGETRGRPAEYPWREMQIGDSVFIAGEREGRAAISSVHGFAKKSVASRWNEKEQQWFATGRKQFTSRKESGGVRIWRIEDRKLEEDELTPPIEGTNIRFIRE